jgi:transcriptional regulator with XRE-family HTH domain
MGIVMTPYIRLLFWRQKANKGRGMSQTELARRVGVSQVLISQIERGDQQSINLELLGKLAKALGVEPRDLVADDGE